MFNEEIWGLKPRLVVALIIHCSYTIAVNQGK